MRSWGYVLDYIFAVLAALAAGYLAGVPTAVNAALLINALLASAAAWLTAHSKTVAGLMALALFVAYAATAAPALFTFMIAYVAVVALRAAHLW